MKKKLKKKLKKKREKLKFDFKLGSYEFQPGKYQHFISRSDDQHFFTIDDAYNFHAIQPVVLVHTKICEASPKYLPYEET